mmetsp:Transcript_16824/g.37338  ORF Transcript_16824/g.37338 Transcript_16824/m.37338 type:complete len:437 (-) Transcript_16824:1049-2359(-)
MEGQRVPAANPQLSGDQRQSNRIEQRRVRLQLSLLNPRPGGGVFASGSWGYDQLLPGDGFQARRREGDSVWCEADSSGVLPAYGPSQLPRAAHLRRRHPSQRDQRQGAQQGGLQLVRPVRPHALHAWPLAPAGLDAAPLLRQGQDPAAPAGGGADCACCKPGLRPSHRGAAAALPRRTEADPAREEGGGDVRRVVEDPLQPCEQPEDHGPHPLVRAERHGRRGWGLHLVPDSPHRRQGDPLRDAAVAGGDRLRAERGRGHHRVQPGLRREPGPPQTRVRPPGDVHDPGSTQGAGDRPVAAERFCGVHPAGGVPGGRERERPAAALLPRAGHALTLCTWRGAILPPRARARTGSPLRFRLPASRRALLQARRGAGYGRIHRGHKVADRGQAALPHAADRGPAARRRGAAAAAVHPRLHPGRAYLPRRAGSGAEFNPP